MAKRHSELFKFEWAYCPDGYEIKDITSSLRHSGIKTILDEAITTRQLVPKSNKTTSYSFSKFGKSAARELTGVIDDHGDIREDLLISFVNNYGPLTYQPNQYIDDWKKLAEQCLIIFEHHDRTKNNCEQKFRQSFTQEQKIILNDIALLKFKESNFIPRFKISLSTGKNNQSRGIQFSPHDLSAAIILLVAEELASGIDLVKCGNSRCHQWFDCKSNKQFCSDKCRASQYKRSHKQPKHKSKGI